ncbi:DUF771 domain-containing protein [Heyndrickxia coagulans]|uniref:DUF771 domain-containing protein n=1 Tax=Heyndrickxia coagulans TaxID=1398 RepID=UPI003D1B6E04
MKPEEKVWWSMQDLVERTGYSHVWLKNKILLNPIYKKMLDLENGGPVYYPQSRGDKWCFIADRMEEFLIKNFAQIFKGGSKHA